jgi:hypothetical protein
MLQAMVEEMNRYGEASMPVLRYLNTRPEIDISAKQPHQRDVKLWVNHTMITVQDNNLTKSQWIGHPLLTPKIQLVYQSNEDNNKNKNNKSTIPLGLDVAAIQQIRQNRGVSSCSSFDKSNQSSTRTAALIEFSPCDLIKVDATKGMYIFSRNTEGTHHK